MELNVDYLSGPFFHFPKQCWDFVVEALQKLSPNLPIVSVGSGNGYLEQLLHNEFPEREFLCVEPVFNGWLSLPDEELGMKPVCATVDDSTLDHVVGNCVMLLFWPSPNANGYDVEAIERLQPEALIVTYGPCGCAGSDNLRKLLDDNGEHAGLDPARPALREITPASGKLYHLKTTYSVVCGTGYGFSGKTLRLVVYTQGWDNQWPFTKKEDWIDDDNENCVIA